MKFIATIGLILFCLVILIGCATDSKYKFSCKCEACALENPEDRSGARTAIWGSWMARNSNAKVATRPGQEGLHARHARNSYNLHSNRLPLQSRPTLLSTASITM